MFLTNRAFQNTRNAQGGGFSRKPGNMAGQEASSGLMVPALPGASPEAGTYTLINQLGTQGAFQYLMESNGYSMGNVLARPSAEQAYAILKSANLSPKAIQVLLEDNGYPSDIVFKSSSLSPENGSSAYHTLSNILEESGLQPDEIQSLLRDKGYSLDEEKAQSVVHNALQSAGLSPQEIQNVMENRDHSFQKPFGSLPVSAAGGNSNYPADSGMLAGTKQNRKGNLDLSKSTGYSQEEASLRVAAEKAYAALQSAGLSPQAIQNIMENNGNSLQKLFESAGVDYDSISNILKGTERKQMGPQTLPEKNRDFLKGGRTQPAAEKAYAALQSAGLSPREIQNLLGNNGHSFQKILDFPALTSENNSLSHSAVSRMLEKADFQQNDPQNQQKRNGYSLGQERDLKLSLAPLEKGMEESLANLEKEGILGNEESTIQSRNSARGKAAAVLHFDVDLNSRQKSLLEKLPEFNSRTTVPKESVNMTDLSALTAKTGVEFAMFTKGNQRLIVRGNTIKTPIYLEEAKQLAQEGYRWSGHTHPGTTSNALMYSSGDVDILKCFPQEKSIIYNSIGLFADFRKDDL